MTRRRRSRGPVRLAVLTGLAVAAGTAASPREAAGLESGFNVRIGWPTTAAAVEAALAGARERLGDPECAAVVEDFEDRAGRPLAAALQEKGRSLQDHLGFLFFYDGSTRARCRASRTLAFTSPGSHVVFVCGERFAAARELQPDRAEVYLIHEVLHTLGLGENPPTPDEITGAVLDRCHERPVRAADRRRASGAGRGGVSPTRGRARPGGD